MNGARACRVFLVAVAAWIVASPVAAEHSRRTLKLNPGALKSDPDAQVDADGYLTFSLPRVNGKALVILERENTAVNGFAEFLSEKVSFSNNIARLHVGTSMSPCPFHRLVVKPGDNATLPFISQPFRFESSSNTAECLPIEKRVASGKQRSSQRVRIEPSARQCGGPVGIAAHLQPWLVAAEDDFRGCTPTLTDQMRKRYEICKRESKMIRWLAPKSGAQLLCPERFEIEQAEKLYYWSLSGKPLVLKTLGDSIQVTEPPPTTSFPLWDRSMHEVVAFASLHDGAWQIYWLE